MPPRRSRLRDLRIEEVALCRQGMNPEAHIVLYKRHDEPMTDHARPSPSRLPVAALLELAKGHERIEVGPLREALAKQDHAPRTFDEIFEDGRRYEIDAALDTRAHTLIRTTTEAMYNEGLSMPERQRLVLAAVQDYADAMERDVPDLFAGRLAKRLTDLGADGPPKPSAVAAVVKAALDEAGLPADNGGGAPMFWKSLTERGQRALKYVLGDRDPAQFFKGTTDEVSKLVGGLLEKAGEWAERVDGLEADLTKSREEIATLRKSGGSESDLEALLKGVTDPSARRLIETQHAALKSQGGEIRELRKAAQRSKLSAIAKALTCLPNENDALVVILEKADNGGWLDDLEKVLRSANRQAEIGKAMVDLGVDSLPGEGALGSPDEADAALVAKAVELRKIDGSLTAEQAYAKACELHPDLYSVASGLVRHPAH